MTRKREMIRELTNSAWNILANLQEEVEEGILAREEAQAEAIRQVRHLHYGPAMKDYFWINDMTPRMVVHPYRTDLEGKNLTVFTDPAGKALFKEVVETVREQGAGYVDYQWQLRDDSTEVGEKVSYVRLFKPWGWVIGTGVYLEDVRREVAWVKRRVLAASVAILVGVSLLLAVIVWESHRTEKIRRATEKALRESEERYRMAVESAGESIIIAIGADQLYANTNALNLLGYTLPELRQLRLTDVTWLAEDELSTLLNEASSMDEEVAGKPRRHETQLRTREGHEVPVMLSVAPVNLGGRAGLILVATDITKRKAAEEELGRSESALRDEIRNLGRFERRARGALERVRRALALMSLPIDADSPLTLAEPIKASKTPDEVARINEQLPEIVHMLLDSGAGAKVANKVVSTNSDVVVGKCIEFALAELGPPPVPFAFLVMGSEGRHEQTLCTDQDNAIIFADPPAEKDDMVKHYFRELGARVCQWLHAAGYAFCKGKMMACNPQWCASATQWRSKFLGWLSRLEPEDLLQVKIVFDFRCAYGDDALTDMLRAFLWEEMPRRPRFLAQMARDVVQYTPPIGTFGRLVSESKEEGRKVIDVKAAMVPMVDFARTYALREGLSETNTVLRLNALQARGILSEANHREMVQVYESLMTIRLEHQVRKWLAGSPANNELVIDDLTHLERRILRESFSAIRDFQTRLSYDFTGLPGAVT
ncbi:MAG: DUF294 nucleotidyltransferase-like domain-containing protein [Candidatus Pacebacteria bacterium]|nr:DUF294 nucleotidyltransferase-like domain-containing protein [Candidatus Paceibacterota bacterium]